MKKVWTLAKKEFGEMFKSPIGYVFAGLFLIVSLWLYWQDFFVIGLTDLSGLWNNLLFLMAFFVPAVGMGLIADEKKKGTWETLLSLPIKEKELVWGKFLGSGLFLVVVMALFLPTVISVSVLGQVDLGVIFSSFLGICLLALSFLATTLFFSTLSENGVVAFLLAMVFLVINSFLGGVQFLSRIPLLVRGVVSYFSFSSHFMGLASGVLRLEDLLFFGSYILVFISFSILALKARND